MQGWNPFSVLEPEPFDSGSVRPSGRDPGFKPDPTGENAEMDKLLVGLLFGFSMKQ